MIYTYCPDCGGKLNRREVGDEGSTPWCDHCQRPWFPSFSTCVIGLVHNPEGKVLLLQQNYISKERKNLVSGYMKPGESAEEAMRREIKEETGLEVIELELTGTYWFDKKGLLMIGFFAKVEEGELKLSREVDGASWHTADEAIGLVHQRPTSTSRILTQAFFERTRL